MSEARQLVLRGSLFCGTCPEKYRCVEQRTELGCSPDFAPAAGSGAHWLHAELALLEHMRVVVCLGAFAWEAGLRHFAPALRPKPRFGHAVEAEAGPVTLLGCFHPSQQNTFTDKLTPPMLEAVLLRARELAA